MDDLSILVCDDSQPVRQKMVDTLLSIGVPIIYEASDGDEAVSICRNKRPGLVFMDIIMPNKDGIAALKEIQQMDPSIKVVMASSTSGLSHLKKSKLLGAYTFIQKPIEEEKIRDIITKYLEEYTDAPYSV